MTRQPEITAEDQPVALERQHAEDALVHAPQWLPLDESLEAFDPQCELTQGQRSFTRQTPLAQSLEVLGQGVLQQ